MKWRSVEKDSDNKLAVPASWLFPHYYDALTVLFRVENTLRLFVYVVATNFFRPLQGVAKWG